jgi:hypothetical protein
MAWGLALMSMTAFFMTQMFPEKKKKSSVKDDASARAEEAPKPVPNPGHIHRRIGTRNPLPRPTAATEAAVEGTPTAPEDVVEPAIDEGVMFTPESIMASMNTVTPGITDCAQDWKALVEQELEGRMVLEMTLGPEGVSDAALVDVDEVPEAMLSCFGVVVYEAEWPLPEEATDVAWPFSLSFEVEE